MNMNLVTSVPISTGDVDELLGCDQPFPEMAVNVSRFLKLSELRKEGAVGEKFDVFWK